MGGSTGRWSGLIDGGGSGASSSGLSGGRSMVLSQSGIWRHLPVEQSHVQVHAAFALPELRVMQTMQTSGPFRFAALVTRHLIPFRLDS